MKRIFAAVLIISAFVSCERNDIYSILESQLNKTYNLRDRGPAGGWIFHIVDNGDDTYTYYEAAPGDAGSFLQWLSVDEWLNNNLVDGETLTAIGTGKNNTAKIMQYKGVRAAPAAEYCDGLNINGYSDWFLPSRDELDKMCWNLAGVKSGSVNPDVPGGGVGGFTSNNYWSSSEEASYSACARHFGDGFEEDINKVIVGVETRAVRTFIR